MTDRIVFLPELIETIGVSRTTINRWRAAGKLPEPDCKMSQRWQGWRRSTLERVGLLLPETASPQTPATSDDGREDARPGYKQRGPHPQARGQAGVQ